MMGSFFLFVWLFQKNVVPLHRVFDVHEELPVDARL